MSVKYITSFDEYTELINGDKPIVIDFTATWCGPCKVIGPVFEKFAGEEKHSHIGFYKVDVDEQSEIAQKAGIRAMPTFIAYKNGQVIHQFSGANPALITDLLAKV